MSERLYTLKDGPAGWNSAAEGPIESNKPSHKRKWFIWHEPGATREQIKLVSKLDFFILLYACLTFFVKYLDQTNVNSAWFAGMRGELKLHGDELNWLTTYFNIGVIIGAPLSTSMLTIVQPRFWIPLCTFCWSFFVLFMYKAQNIETLYGLRFCCGLFEACVYPGMLYIIGSWYRRTEISQRTAVFLFSSIVGGMTSQFIQSGLLNIDNALGHSSWRWLFILDFVISLPVALFGFFCCPGEPKGPKIWWMTEKEREMCIERMASDGRDARGKWDWTLIKRILRSWEFYAFIVAWALVEMTCGLNAQRWMGLWLKSFPEVDGKPQYYPHQVLELPTVIGVTQLAFVFLSAVLADVLNNRAIPFAFLGCVQLFSYIVLYVRTSNRSLRFAAYYLMGAYSGLSPLLGGWLGACCHGDKQVRVFVTSLMISIGYAVETPVQQVVFPVSQAPDFRPTHGYRFGLIMVIVMIIWCSVIMPVLQRVFGRSKA